MLILQELSNHFKTIALSGVLLLYQKHEHVLDELVMNIFRVLNSPDTHSPDTEVRRKALAITLKITWHLLRDE